MFDFTGITEIGAPEGSVVKIESGSEVLWEKLPPPPQTTWVTLNFISMMEGPIAPSAFFEATIGDIITKDYIMSHWPVEGNYAYVAPDSFEVTEDIGMDVLYMPI